MTSRFRKLSQSLYECKYPVVFCPKYRYRIFKDAIGEYAKQQVYQLCKQNEQVVVLELNVQPDHVHLVVEIPPKYAVSEFMGYHPEGRGDPGAFLRRGPSKYRHIPSGPPP